LLVISAIEGLLVLGLIGGLVTSSVLWSQNVNNLQTQINNLTQPNVTVVPLINQFGGYSPDIPFTGDQIQCVGSTGGDPNPTLPSQNCDLTYVDTPIKLGPTFLGAYSLLTLEDSYQITVFFGGEFFYASNTNNDNSAGQGGSFNASEPFTWVTMSVFIPNVIPAPYRPTLPQIRTGVVTYGDVPRMLSAQCVYTFDTTGGFSFSVSFGNTVDPAVDRKGWRLSVMSATWIVPR
jgi:hypothetical protein